MSELEEGRAERCRKKTEQEKERGRRWYWGVRKIDVGHERDSREKGGNHA